MILTEAEAKTKWCPFARVPWLKGQHPTINGIAVNRQAIDERTEDDSHIPAEPKCLASGCSCWREIAVKKEGKVTVFDMIKTEDRVNHLNLIDQLPSHVQNDYVKAGYCGLAGKP